MNVKSQVIKELISMLTKLQGELRYKIRDRVWQLKRLEEDQAIDKRKLGEIQLLINSLTSKEKDLTKGK